MTILKAGLLLVISDASNDASDGALMRRSKTPSDHARHKQGTQQYLAAHVGRIVGGLRLERTTDKKAKLYVYQVFKEELDEVGGRGGC